MMGIIVLLFVELFCPPLRIGHWVFPWSPNDNKVLDRARVVCYNRYYSKGSPCVVSIQKFTRRDGGPHYDVTCGSEEQ